MRDVIASVVPDHLDKKSTMRNIGKFLLIHGLLLNCHETSLHGIRISLTFTFQYVFCSRKYAC